MAIQHDAPPTWLRVTLIAEWMVIWLVALPFTTEHPYLWLIAGLLLLLPAVALLEGLMAMRRWFK